jgi:hypothetical protein
MVWDIILALADGATPARGGMRYFSDRALRFHRQVKRNPLGVGQMLCA